MRGHNLGRLITEGTASANTGIPGIIAGIGKERVIYSEFNGYIKNIEKIEDISKITPVMLRGFIIELQKNEKFSTYGT